MKKSITAFIFLSLLITTSILYANSGYQIYIDAGSSGSRIHLFKYETVNDTLPLITEIFSEQTAPGISSYINNPKNAGVALKKLLDDTSQQLESLGVTPAQPITVNLFATAGMRLLPIDQQNPIYNSISDYIKSNYTLLTPGDIKTISGTMEGLYGWLDVNYLAGNFQNHQPTVGTLDMGGASTQIVFEPQLQNSLADEITLIINGEIHHVWSKSFLGLGQDQARAAMGNLAQHSACYPTDYLSQENSSSQFNFSQCQKNYQSIINIPKIMPVEGQAFIAFSGAYYNYQFFQANQTPEQDLFENHIQAFCNQPWNQIQKNFPSLPDSYLASYCANAIYIDTLFYSTYHLQGQQLTITTKINNKSIDWPLGAVLSSFIRLSIE